MPNGWLIRNGSGMTNVLFQSSDPEPGQRIFTSNKTWTTVTSGGTYSAAYRYGSGMADVEYRSIRVLSQNERNILRLIEIFTSSDVQGTWHCGMGRQGTAIHDVNARRIYFEYESSTTSVSGIYWGAKALEDYADEINAMQVYIPTLQIWHDIDGDGGSDGNNYMDTLHNQYIKIDSRFYSGWGESADIPGCVVYSDTVDGSYKTIGAYRNKEIISDFYY